MASKKRSQRKETQSTRSKPVDPKKVEAVARIDNPPSVTDTILRQLANNSGSRPPMGAKIGVSHQTLEQPDVGEGENRPHGSGAASASQPEGEGSNGERLLAPSLPVAPAVTPEAETRAIGLTDGSTTSNGGDRTAELDSGQLTRLQQQLWGAEKQKDVLVAENEQLRTRLAHLRQQGETLIDLQKDVDDAVQNLEGLCREFRTNEAPSLALVVQTLEGRVRHLRQQALDLASKNGELQARLDTANPNETKSLRERIDELKEDNRRLNAKLTAHHLDVERAQASIDRLQSLERLEDDYRRLSGEREALAQQNADLRVKLAAAQAERSQLGAYESQYAAIKSKYDSMVRDRLQDAESAFRALEDVMESALSAKTPRLQSWPSDREVARRAQQVATDCAFVFDDFQIRWLLAAMRSSRLVILKGFSGTGKTSLPVILARAIGAECEVIPVQPSWKSKVDLMGFFNHFDQRFLPTQFTKALFRAQLPGFKDRHYFVILDEMNLARVEYYFNDFLLKLEKGDKETVELFEASAVARMPEGNLSRYILEGNRLQIPSNVTVFGTINDDETTFSISDKVYDRAQVVEFYDTSKTGNGKLPESPAPTAYTIDSYRAALGTESSDPNLDDFLGLLNDALHQYFVVGLGPRPRNQIRRFIHAYCQAGGNQAEALDLQVVSKALPKLRYGRGSGYGEKLDQFRSFLTECYPYSQKDLPHTSAVIKLGKRKIELT